MILKGFLIGTLLSIFIWIVGPYFNFYFRLGFVSDSYLPILGLMVLFILVFLVNPFLKRYFKKCSLNSLDIAIISGIVFMASIISGQGFCRQFPYILVKAPLEASIDPEISKIYEKMRLPGVLFPEKPILNSEVPACQWFVDELPEGEHIPWNKWVGVLFSWSIFFAFCWMFMVGLSYIFFKHWKENERLVFPLVTFCHTQLIQEEGYLPSIYKNKMFWIGCFIVVLLYVLYGLHQYFPNRVPYIPLEWNIHSALEGTILRSMRSCFYSNRIYFIFVGISFFIPVRISFSIWFIALLFSIHNMIMVEFFPPHPWQMYNDHRTGATVVITGYIIWLSRDRWIEIFKSLFIKRHNEIDPVDKTAGWLFLGGIMGMVIWLLWVGVPLVWIVFLVICAFMVCTVSARLVGETGMPFLRIDSAYPSDFLQIFVPNTWLDHISLYFAGIFNIFFYIGSRMNATAMGVHAIGIADHVIKSSNSNIANRNIITRFIFYIVVILIAGSIICSMVNIYMCYNHSAPFNGSPPINDWGLDRMRWVHSIVKNFDRGDFKVKVSYNQRGHILFGGILAAILEWGYLNIPRWPFHPIGLLLLNTYYTDQALASIFLGWLIKVFVLRYGGAEVYRKIQPLFVGLIAGEILSTLLWIAVTGIAIAFGYSYEMIYTQPL